MEPLLCPMRAASLPCPHWRPIFANFSLTLWVTKYFLGIGRKVNSFAAILLVVSSSQLLFLGLSTSVDTGNLYAGNQNYVSPLLVIAVLIVLFTATWIWLCYRFQIPGRGGCVQLTLNSAKIKNAPNSDYCANDRCGFESSRAQRKGSKRSNCVGESTEGGIAAGGRHASYLRKSIDET